MRWGILILLALVAGCAVHQPATPSAAAYEPVAVAALAFDPPVITGQPPLDLWRDGRALKAFWGYEELSATYQYLRTDDRQTTDHSDVYTRRSVSEKVGVSYR